ncbi:amino acid adenylation domain-containing protein [Bacillus sp. F9_6S_D1_P_5]
MVNLVDRVVLSSQITLQTDHDREEFTSFTLGKQSISIAAATLKGLHQISQQVGVSQSTVLLAAYSVFIQRYSSQEELVICIVNTDRFELALFDSLGEISFRKLLEQLHTGFQKKANIQEWLWEKGSIPLLFQHIENEVWLDNRKLEGYDLYLLSSFAEEVANLTFYYNAELFEQDTIIRMLESFQVLLEGIVCNLGEQITRLPLLNETEQQQILVNWNNTQVGYPRKDVIHEQLEEQAERTPEAVAVVYEDQKLTYQELNEKANQLAHYLQKRGIGPDSLVGLCVERSPEMIVGLFGILKAGGAYVPLDPTYPQKRLRYIVEDAGIQVLVTKETLLELFSEEIEVICLDRDQEKISLENSTSPDSKVTIENLAYVIYTSGSTGNPKGALVQHHSVLNLSYGLQKEVFLHEIPTSMRVGLNASIAFDASVQQLQMLLYGSSLYIIPNEVRSNPRQFVSYIRENKLEMFDITPSLLQLLIDGGLLEMNDGVHVPSKVLVGGEVIMPSLWEQLVEADKIHFYNVYGPTECTVDATCYHIKKDSKRVTIGRPLPNVQTYVLDRNGLPVPVGVTGELYIGGAGLARGYLNRPELTSERFIPHPFKEGERLYRTGDLVKYLPDGNLEYIGRIDSQVKIRGFRIELGEIEAALLEYSSVKEVVVLAREDNPGDKRLVAYVVGNGSRNEWREHLKGRLPSYMIPAHFIEMEVLPLTPNGKIDREILPAPKEQLVIENVLSPRTPVEELVASIWSEVLGMEHIGIQDSFFELGGHSLLATQVAFRLQDAFQIELSVRELFEYSTIETLAERVVQLRQRGQKRDLPPLKRVERGKPLPLSYAQQRMWFLHSLNQEYSVYNIPIVLHLEGNLNIKAFKSSITEIVRRHESFRTRIWEGENGPVQQIQEQIKVDVPLIHLDQAEAEDVYHLAKQLNDKPFNLSQGTLFRSVLVQTSKQDYYLIWIVHHIISDGWSTELFKKELMILYSAFNVGKPSPLVELPIQYADYAHWQQEWIQGNVLKQQLQYWKQRLSGILPVLQLPIDKPRPPVQRFHGAIHEFVISQDLSKRIKELSHKFGMTTFMTLLAALNTLLYRYSGQEDILIGSPIANRNSTEIEGLMGFFVNTLVMRTELSNNPRFTELMEQVRRVSLEAYAHQDIPFEKLVQELHPERNQSYSPLFQVMFVMQSSLFKEEKIPGLNICQHTFDTEMSKFDLTLFVTEVENGLQASLEYNTDLFDKVTIERMAEHFCCLLRSISSDPQQRLSEISLLTETERELMLINWNNTQVGYPRKDVIHKQLEEQAERTPEAVAVVYEDQKLTYQELNEKANQLAHYLQKRGIGPDSLVGLCVERSPEMIVGLFGILKAGGAYVPLDPTYPQKRLRYIVEDAGIQVLVTKETLLELFSEEIEVICLDRDQEKIYLENSTSPDSKVTIENLAYVIYTSGSTGNPKGVMIEHHGLIDYLTWALDAYEVEKGIGTIVSSSLAFDATITSLFPPLLIGGKAILLREGEEIEQLSEMLRKYKNLSLLKITPAHLQLLNQQLSSEDLANRVRTVVIGGEALLGENITFWQQAAPETRIINEYGPTETVVGCSVYHASEIQKGPVPIGRPITNKQFYILDSLMQPVPIGVIGELYIGGVGLARGYLNRPELTSERFIPHPFKQGERLYRTGDLVKYLPDGNLEYIGRIDSQVKIRGFRIELGEIEAALLEHSSVKEVVVLAREDNPGDKRLVAYVVGNGNSNEWREYLKGRLPSYMIPTHFIEMEVLPLTPNGKIDRKILPAPKEQLVIENVLSPRTPVEELVASIWSEVLGMEHIGIQDSFFELGGHSLLATQVAFRLQDAFQIELSVRELFEHSTVETLAERVVQLRQRGQKRNLPPLKRVERGNPLPLSYAQHRLWFIDQLEGASALYNIVLPLHIVGNLNEQALVSAVQEIVNRHEVLRTTFTEVEGSPMQVIKPPSEIQLSVIDLSRGDLGVQSTQVQQLIKELTDYKFDLSQGPLFRSHLVKIGKCECVLVMVMHHIISDGWSNELLIREFGQFYESFATGQSFSIPELPVQYVDYAAWQRNWLEGGVLESQLGYWKRNLADAPPLLEIRTDYPRPLVQSYRGAVQKFELSIELSSALKTLSRTAGVTLFMTLMAAYKTLLFRETEKEDISVGFPVANRNRSEAEGLIGFFVNTLILRTDLSGNPTFQEVLQQVQEMALEAYANQDIPFEKIVEELHPERNRSYSPLCQVMFVLQKEVPTILLDCHDIRMTVCEVEEKFSKFDLTFFMEERGGKLIGNVEYSTDLFRKETIEKMISQFQLVLESVVKHPEKRLREIQLGSVDVLFTKGELNELFD